MAFIICAIIGYLLGSISTAMVLTKFFGMPDPREAGSGNPGATNVLRTAGRNQAAMVLAGDILKGVVALLIARIFGVQGFALGLVAVATVVGHMFPVYFGFKGGKGIATSLGCLLMLSFWVGLITLAVWVAVLIVSKYVSLSSLVAAIAAPILTLFFGDAPYFIPVLIITVLIIWRHWSNIQRLRAGNENKVKF